MRLVWHLPLPFEKATVTGFQIASVHSASSQQPPLLCAERWQAFLKLILVMSNCREIHS